MNSLEKDFLSTILSIKYLAISGYTQNQDPMETANLAFSLIKDKESLHKSICMTLVLLSDTNDIWQFTYYDELLNKVKEHEIEVSASSFRIGLYSPSRQSNYLH